MAEPNTNRMTACRPTVADALDRLFDPRTIAVVGASRTKGKLGQAVMALLKSNGYSGTIIPVNPSGGEIEGLPAVRSLDEINSPIDVVVLATPVELLAQSYRDEFALMGPGVGGALLLLVFGSLLGVLGAVLAVSRHLSEIEPG